MARFASHLAEERYPCPRCGAAVGARCITPSGRTKRGFPVHGERLRQLTDDEWKACTIPALNPFQELFRKEGTT